MNYKIFTKGLRTLVLMLAALALAAGPSYAVDLVAIEGQWSPDGGTTQIPMWGFASDTGQACGSLPAWTVGPQLGDADLVAGNLTINLRNCLSEPVSIVIPGQPATFTPQTVDLGDGRLRVRAFTNEVPADGATVTPYTWTGVKAGTYLYQSGSHPAKQVQMGLYGALTTGSYPDTSGDVTLLYSEIDPALHSPPAAATPLGYKPRHYLVNGEVTQLTPLTAGNTNQPTVLRFLNAGLDFHVPALNGGHMSLVAEDGNAYPFPKVQYSANLAAGKTIDALWQPASDGDHVIYDRRGNGMVASLTVTLGVGAPIANPDPYVVDEDMPLDVLISFDLDGITPLTGVLANDTAADTITVLTVPPASANLVSSTLAGILSFNANGSFTYTPNADFNGIDTFTYKANDGTLDSNVASVTITVNPMNDAPVAVDDSFSVVTDSIGNVLDVLANDIDVDGDTLTITAVGSTNNGGIATTDGSTVIYSPAVSFVGDEIFTYDIADGNGGTDTATVTVTVAAPVNNPPVASDGSATVVRNSAATFIDMRPFVSDPDNNLCIDPVIIPPSDNSISCTETTAVLPADRINVTTGTTSTRGGTVTVLDNGVTYAPKRNFRGTDTFDYNVTDADGATSSPDATVRINVIRP